MAPAHGFVQFQRFWLNFSAFPESEHGAVPVGGDPGTLLAQDQRADGERGAALTDPGRHLVRVPDCEVPDPDGKMATALAASDPGDRFTVCQSHREVTAERVGLNVQLSASRLYR